VPHDRLADLPYASALTPHQGDLAAEEDYEGAHFDKLDFDAPRAPGSRFLECAFTQVTVQDGRLRRARFNDVWLDGVRLTATELTDSSWIEATIIGSLAAGGDRARVTAASGHLPRLQAARGELPGGPHSPTSASRTARCARSISARPPCGAASSPAHSSRRRTSARSPWTRWTCAVRSWASS